MKKREAEFLESLIRDEYQTVLSWMSNGCKGSLWNWYQQLKPCPLCGGEAKVGKDNDTDCFYVQCSNDECDCVLFTVTKTSFTTSGTLPRRSRQRNG
jgi:hypothetical protein